MKANTLNSLFNNVNKVQAIIYLNDQYFQETFFKDSWSEKTYIAEISFGDHIIFVKLGHTELGAYRKVEIDSEDFIEWLSEAKTRP